MAKAKTKESTKEEVKADVVAEVKEEIKPVVKTKQSYFPGVDVVGKGLLEKVVSADELKSLSDKGLLYGNKVVDGNIVVLYVKEKE